MSASLGYAALHWAGIAVLAATAINWLLASWAGPLAWLALWLVATLKCRIVIRSFMGLATAPRIWQHAFDAWLLGVLIIVAAGCWMARA